MKIAAQRQRSATRRNGAARSPEELVYPYSDGEPMGESNAHIQSIRWILDALEDLLRDRQNLSIHGDMFWYWQEGRPDLNRAPDAMVIFGVPMDPVRLSFKSWEHGGIVPTVIIETASAAQEALLFGDILRDYEREGVREYFVFDWSGRYLDYPLYGYRLRGTRYQPIRPRKDGAIASNQLGALLRPEGQMLRFINSADGIPVLTRLEQIAEQAAELKRARDLLRKAGIDPDATR